MLLLLTLIAAARVPDPAAAPAFIPQPPPATAADSFPHARHPTLACLTCHTSRSGRGALRIRAPESCDRCHHQRPDTADCEACHQADDLATGVQVNVPVLAGGATRLRSWLFPHKRHGAVPCLLCHPSPGRPAPAAETPTCATCHAEHGAATGDCSLCHRPDCRSCHRLQQPLGPHQDAQTVHERCDACHARATLADVMPARPFCGTCHHAERTDHHPERECSVCHFLAEPEALRRRLMPPGSP